MTRSDLKWMSRVLSQSRNWLCFYFMDCFLSNSLFLLPTGHYRIEFYDNKVSVFQGNCLRVTWDLFLTVGIVLLFIVIIFFGYLVFYFVQKKVKINKRKKIILDDPKHIFDFLIFLIMIAVLIRLNEHSVTFSPQEYF